MKKDRLIRITIQTRLVLSQFSQESPRAELYGAKIGEQTKIGFATVYKILSRFEKAGWLVSRLESEKVANKLARPQRRYYRMTKIGREQAKERIG